MGKRTNYKKIARDFYATPIEAVSPIVPHLVNNETFYEPCHGKGDLIRHLENYKIKCVGCSDLVDGQNALDIKNVKGDLFITNPPWTWKILTALISHLCLMKPTWLLLNADVMHNKRMSKHMKYCEKIVSVGRISWMQNGINGYENCAWFLFNKEFKNKTEFYARLEGSGLFPTIKSYAT
tara:strand:- start:311 stop:850 length:540 start_codon:yes stop_codon:yes gene_type:complete